MLAPPRKQTGTTIDDLEAPIASFAGRNSSDSTTALLIPTLNCPGFTLSGNLRFQVNAFRRDVPQFHLAGPIPCGQSRAVGAEGKAVNPVVVCVPLMQDIVAVGSDHAHDA